MACGQKPDGTPYGVNPVKHPNGYRLTPADITRPNHYTKGVPKGAEVNAVTGSATVGQAQGVPGH